jgi:hypothetical protein
MPIIYHGTPMTPRASLLDVCAGRAMCVSFYRPDDAEVVEAISPAIMFRQWRVFLLESGAEGRARVGSGSRLVGLLRMAGAALVSPRTLGGHSRHAGRTVSAQRCTVERMAARPARRAAVAYGRAYRAAAAAVREIRPGVSRLGRAGQRYRLSRLPRTDGGSRQGFGQPLACLAHDAWDGGCFRLPLHQRRQHLAGAERVAL